MPFFTEDPMVDDLARVPCDRCREFDYSDVAQGVIRCRTCVRVWKLETWVSKNNPEQIYSRWEARPCPGCTSHRSCRHKQEAAAKAKAAKDKPEPAKPWSKVMARR